jgi:hypothetical protein
MRLEALKERIATVYGWAKCIAFIATMIACSLMFLRAIEPCWPIFSLAFFGGLTLVTFGYKWSGIASVAGIMIYIASWPITHHFGLAIGLSVWATGVILWFWAVYKSIGCTFCPRVA